MTIRIWSLIDVKEESSFDEEVKKRLLAQMSMHTGSVLCVRWSSGTGKYLASSSDDHVIIVWQKEGASQGNLLVGSEKYKVKYFIFPGSKETLGTLF